MIEREDLLTTEELEDARPKGGDEGDMDLTPMVDVTFLLLIFFMITAAFAVQKAINVPPVNEDEAVTEVVESTEDDSIVVRVDEDNVFWIGASKWDEEQRAVSQADMRNKVREAREGGATAPTRLLVQAHGDARHGSMVAALDMGPSVGIDDIRLLFYEEGDLDF
ncbi:biopolymer transporter ExbD [Pirellulales bacterium]|nr:biopolymer transporter ExbD [Pirellulales bacterium]